MESLGEILKKKESPANIPEADTDTWLSAEQKGEAIGNPDCPICRGVGFVHPLSASGDPDFSRVVPCQCRRQNLKKEKLIQLQRYSNLGTLSRLTFDNLLPEGRRDSTVPEANFTQALAIARDFADKPKGWLVLVGANGCGKTHLACAIANRSIDLGLPALYIGASDLLDHLRSAFSPDSRVSYDDLFEKVKKTQVLILDDFGEHAATPWAQEKLYQLINYRYNARLATVVTTCLSLDEIESRISSRMIDPSLSLVFNIVAPDYRGDTKVNREPRPSQRYSRRGRSS
jgi:DNA replication protein DnaC